MEEINQQPDFDDHNPTMTDVKLNRTSSKESLVLGRKSSTTTQYATLELTNEKDGISINDDHTSNVPNPAYSPSISVISDESPKTGLAKCMNIFKHRIEPLLLCIIVGMAFDMYTNKTLLIEKSCRVNFNQSEELCKNYTKYPVGSKIQSMVTNYVWYKNILETVPAFCLSFFLGAFSDKYGRKIPMFLGITGFTIANAANFICAAIDTLPAEYLLISSVFQGLSGGLMSAMIGIFSYISDRSTPETRFYSIARADLAMAGGIAIGIVASGEVMSRFGYMPVYAVSLLFLTIGYFYLMFVIEESIVRPDKYSMTFKGMVQALFDLDNVKENLSTVFKYRPGNRRMHILNMILCMGILLIPFIGEGSIMLQFSEKKFGWTQQDVSYYSAIGIAMNVVGLVVLFMFVLRRFNINEYILGSIGVAGAIVKGCLIGFSDASWMLYAATAFTFFQPVTIPLVKSMLSKMVHENEQGKLFAVAASFEGATPLFATTVYTQVYNASMDTFPGAPFLVTAGLAFIPLASFGFVYYDSTKRGNRTENLRKKTKEQNVESQSDKQ